MAGIVGARVRLQSLTANESSPAFVQSYNENCYFLSLEEIDAKYNSGPYLVQGIKSGNLYTTTGTIERVKPQVAILRSNQQPKIKYLDFEGSFLRTPLQGALGSPLKKTPCTVIAMGSSQFIAESSVDFSSVRYAALSIFDSERELPYNIKIESVFPYGKLFRTVGTIEHPARVLSMYWQKLAKSA